jgi:hypothetical protein
LENKWIRSAANKNYLFCNPETHNLALIPDQHLAFTGIEGTWCREYTLPVGIFPQLTLYLVQFQEKLDDFGKKGLIWVEPLLAGQGGSFRGASAV